MYYINTYDKNFKPKETSLVVDKSGKPLVVYHGTGEKFTVFDLEQGGRSTEAKSAKNAIFFANDKRAADGYLIDFEKEIEITEKYIEIEKIKQQNSFDVTWHIDERIPQNTKIVKFMLQPIIENAFEHGIRSLYDKRGAVEITAQLSGNTIVFTISDNGGGVEEKRLKELQAKLSTVDLQCTKHIGLNNVNSRIKMIFGDPYGISINSAHGHTTVIVKVPLVV